MVELSEAEVQTLIGMLELSDPITTPNNNGYKFFPRDADEARAYFRGFACDWSAAQPALIQKGYLSEDGRGLRLTAAGEKLAGQLRQARPPIWYWYKDYYIAVARSRAHADYCSRLFGQDLSQDGFSDMDQIRQMLDLAGLGPGSRALDIGCGNGKITEHISDATGAAVVGIDYIPEAIEQARQRTQAKKDRLSFAVGDLNLLDLPAESFDAVISIDSLYMALDLDAVLLRFVEMLRRNGMLLAFYSQGLEDSAGATTAADACRTDLARALARCGLAYRHVDFSKANYEHLQRKYQIARQLESRYRDEGNQFLYESIAAQSVSSELPYEAADFRLRRYLYAVVRR